MVATFKKENKRLKILFFINLVDEILCRCSVFSIFVQILFYPFEVIIRQIQSCTLPTEKQHLWTIVFPI